jgi:hypothetical protein
MAVGRRALIDRTVELQMRADAARGQVHDLADGLLDHLLGDFAGAMGVGVDRQRLGHADRIAQLDRAALGEAGGHDVLGEIARRIGGRAVHLGRVLAGKRPAAMGGRTAIGVHDDLAPREARVAIGAADDELAGRVHPPLRVLGDPALGQDLADIGLNHGAHVVGGHVGVEMLGRQNDRGHVDGLAALVAHGELAFRVGAERRLRPDLRTSARRRRIAWAYWIGAGISSGVSSTA